jgi:aryl-alcohol dehydrogenase-like predicted oxidoreductase
MVERGRDAVVSCPAMRDDGPARHATPEATAALAVRHASDLPHGYARLGSTGLTVSRVGFGGYRVEDDNDDHRRALGAALDAGCNLIDTSTNYADGGSERLVGSVLGGRPDREAVVVVSKIGYVQGENLALALDREHRGAPFPEMVKYMDGCWHCIHPEFLADQLDRSLGRLGLPTLDVCLLHNPEYFFSDAKRRHRGALDTLRREFDRRLREAFGFFEQAARAGKILWYGVSSNTATAAPHDPEATSLGRMLAAAEAAGGPEHRFRVLQVPLNLFESGGVLVRNTGPGDGRTALELAAASGVGVLINRPLNAFVAHRLLRLADIGRTAGIPAPATCWKAVRDLEVEYRGRFSGPQIATQAAERLFDLADQIAQVFDHVEDVEHWRQIEALHVRPQLRALAHTLDATAVTETRAAWDDWWARTEAAIDRLILSAGDQVAARSGKGRAALHALIDPALPADRRGESLSRKAIWTVASTPGVSSVLVGMRRGPYVGDALGVLSWPPHHDAVSVYRQVESHGRTLPSSPEGPA